MKFVDLLDVMSGVMRFDLCLLTNEGIPVLDDVIDYQLQDEENVGARIDAYCEWFVEVAAAMGKDSMYVELCQVDRHKDWRDNDNES